MPGRSAFASAMRARSRTASATAPAAPLRYSLIPVTSCLRSSCMRSAPQSRSAGSLRSFSRVHAASISASAALSASVVGSAPESSASATGFKRNSAARARATVKVLHAGIVRSARATRASRSHVVERRAVASCSGGFAPRSASGRSADFATSSARFASVRAVSSEPSRIVLGTLHARSATSFGIDARAVRANARADSIARRAAVKSIASSVPACDTAKMRTSCATGAAASIALFAARSDSSSRSNSSSAVGSGDFARRTSSARTFRVASQRKRTNFSRAARESPASDASGSVRTASSNRARMLVRATCAASASSRARARASSCVAESGASAQVASGAAATCVMSIDIARSTCACIAPNSEGVGTPSAAASARAGSASASSVAVAARAACARRVASSGESGRVGSKSASSAALSAGSSSNAATRRSTHSTRCARSADVASRGSEPSSWFTSAACGIASFVPSLSASARSIARCALRPPCAVRPAEALSPSRALLFALSRCDACKALPADATRALVRSSCAAVCAKFAAPAVARASTASSASFTCVTKFVLVA